MNRVFDDAEIHIALDPGLLKDRKGVDSDPVENLLGGIHIFLCLIQPVFHGIVGVVKGRDNAL